MKMNLGSCHDWRIYPKSIFCFQKGDRFHVPGPNLDLLCIQQSDAAPFCEDYAKLYFDAKHSEKGLDTGWLNFWCPFFQKSTLFGQYQMLP